jgi:anti-sigma regulatory factor (Ser/Thr protein kinase)
MAKSSPGHTKLSLEGNDAVHSIRTSPAPCPVTRKEIGPVASDEAVAKRPAQSSAATWPLMSHLELAALPTAVGCARKYARAVAMEFGLSAIADDVELIVSELVTNAVRASDYLRDNNVATPIVRLWLASDLQCMLIRVWDANSQMPVRKDAGADDDSGRGLMLVDALSSEWGAHSKTNGKVIWVLVR